MQRRIGRGGGMQAACLALLLGAGGLSPAFAQSASGIYTCTDANGRRLTSDRPIPECSNREQRVLNPSGTVRERVGPVMTAQERADLEAKERQEAEARAQATEERRRERALLIRYPSRAPHDRERAEALAQVASVIQSANQHVDELLQQRKKLDIEMEFYKKDPSKAPPAVRRQVDEVDQGLAAQKRFIVDREDEIKRINARFDEELVRLNQLWAAPAAAKR